MSRLCRGLGTPNIWRRRLKLLLDENLSDKIVSRILDLYPDSSHVKQHDMVRTSDTLIWDFAGQNDFIIVSKDSDFHQRSLLLGSPPKFIFIKAGNCPTSDITWLLRSNFILITAFANDTASSILILPRTQP